MFRILFFCFCVGSLPLSAQVLINEYSASNLNEFMDSFGRTEDWIELYNDSDQEVNLEGYHLTDKEGKPEKWEIPAGVVIGPKDYLLFHCSGRDLQVGDELHTNFKLSQTKSNEYVGFSDPSGNFIDLYKMELTLVENSRCRMTDGSDEWRISIDPTPNASNDGSNQFISYTATPSIDLEAGFYNGTQTVNVTNNEANSVLRYTLDGTNPTVNSPEYTGALTIDKTTVVKAQSFSNDPNILVGKMDFNTYFIDEEYSLAVFSVAADEVQDLANGNGVLIPIGSIEYFNVEKEREATSFGSLNRHGQDSWVLDHRSLDWVSRDEMGYSRTVKAPLFSHSERDDYQKFMFRNSGDDNYPAIDDGAHEGSTHIRDEYVQTLALEGGLDLDTRAVERVVLYLNGDYWGVYGMRDRPVDHDFTDYYYDQGKYEIQYLSTWGNTEIEYGGIQALNDWASIRDFALENDLSIPENYQKVYDEINLISLIDYMVMNLNVVASDWLNYNTGWWRGLNPEGGHQKWGYILWDLDATFDYYINYSGVPNTDPDADPCDLEEIGDFMDQFFGGGGGGPTLTNAADCSTIQNGSSPYPANDPIYQQVVLDDAFCCQNDWDNICQSSYNDLAAAGSGFENPNDCPVIVNGLSPLDSSNIVYLQVVNSMSSCCDEWTTECQEVYDNILEGNGGGVTTNNDVGKHEKILLKLIDESDDFRQLYYSRYADIMNTIFTCENMNETLDRMLAVIEPEMPRQIDRWGGSMGEWQQNVEDLKAFINARCELLDDGALECYPELTGPFNITLLTQPEGIGAIKFNTIDIDNYPWSGNYFGGMENNLTAKVYEDFVDEWEFSHWISSAGNVISPSANQRIAKISLVDTDTLTAVFTNLTSVNELESDISFQLFPNPSSSHFNIAYELDEAASVSISLYNLMGGKLLDFHAESGRKSAGFHQEILNLDDNIVSGMYLLQMTVDDQRLSRKVSIIR